MSRCAITMYYLVNVCKPHPNPPPHFGSNPRPLLMDCEDWCIPSTVFLWLAVVPLHVHIHSPPPTTPPPPPPPLLFWLLSKPTAQIDVACAGCCAGWVWYHCMYTYTPPSTPSPNPPPSSSCCYQNLTDVAMCRVLFWLAVVLAVTLAIHMLVLAAFLFSRWSTPNLLHFPRPELLVLLIALAAIAQGAASKLSPLCLCPCLCPCPCLDLCLCPCLCPCSCLCPCLCPCLCLRVCICQSCKRVVLHYIELRCSRHCKSNSPLLLLCIFARSNFTLHVSAFGNDKVLQAKFVYRLCMFQACSLPFCSTPAAALMLTHCTRRCKQVSHCTCCTTMHSICTAQLSTDYTA